MLTSSTTVSRYPTDTEFVVMITSLWTIVIASKGFDLAIWGVARHEPVATN
jgi:hypothetical protein